MKYCDNQNNQKWGYLNNQLTNVATGLCLQEGISANLMSVKCDPNNQSQKWNIDVLNGFVVIQNLKTNNALVTYGNQGNFKISHYIFF